MRVRLCQNLIYMGKFNQFSVRLRKLLLLLLVLTSGLTLFSFKTIVLQDNIITGIVKDANGQSLSNVSVVIKGKIVGTTSDDFGKFTIAASENDILVFSYVGFLPKQV